MAGKKPAFSLAANLKEGGKDSNGKKKYMDIGAAWPNDYGGFNFRLQAGVKVRLQDGTVISGDNCWLTLFDKRENKGGQKSMEDDDWGDPRPPRSDADAPPPPSENPDDDIPF